VFVIPLAVAGPRIARRRGARPVMVFGLLLLAAGSVGIALTATTQTYWPVAVCESLAFGGLGLIGGPATESIIDALPPARHGVASAVNDITRQLGIALGVAVLGTLFNAAYRADVGTDGVSADLGAATKDSAAQGLALAAGLPDDLRKAQETSIANAVTLGFVVSCLALAVVLAIGAAVVWRRCPVDAGKAVEADFTAEAWAARSAAGDASGKLHAVLDPLLDRPSVTVAAMAAVAPAPGPVAVPLGLQLVEAAERYEQLLRAAQDRHDELELRIARLEQHEADLRRRCHDLHAEDMGLVARDPIAVPTAPMST
jgi:hypothetical protein